jgi:hypothetical protein
MRKIRIVVTVCGEGFSKICEVSEFLEIKIGYHTWVRLSLDCERWVVCRNFIPGNSFDSIDTYFFESNDENIFLSLCNLLTPEGGWVEVKEVRPVIEHIRICYP